MGVAGTECANNVQSFCATLQHLSMKNPETHGSVPMHPCTFQPLPEASGWGVAVAGAVEPSGVHVAGTECANNVQSFCATLQHLSMKNLETHGSVPMHPCTFQPLPEASSWGVAVAGAVEPSAVHVAGTECANNVQSFCATLQHLSMKTLKHMEVFQCIHAHANHFQRHQVGG